MSTGARSAVFEVTALSKLEIFGPVIRRLREKYDIPSRLIASSEFHNLRTDPDRIRAWGVEPTQLLPIPIGSYGLDWVLANTWVRRNAGRILDELGAAVLVEPSDRTYPHHYFVEAARERKIPSILVQESLRKDEMMHLKGMQWVRRKADKAFFGVDSRLKKYGQGGCSRVTAWGETSKDYYLRVGVPEERIVVTGNPAFDGMRSDWSAAEREVESAIGIDAETKLFVFVTSPLARIGVTSAERQNELTREVLLAFSRFLSEPRHGQFFLLLRPHHLESEEEYRRMVVDMGLEGTVRVDSRLPLYPMLSRAAGVIMFSTTVGLEAALLGKPVIILETDSALDNWEFAETGVAASAADRRDLQAFMELVADPVQRAPLGERGRRSTSRYVAHVGEATDRVAALIADAYEGKIA